MRRVRDRLHATQVIMDLDHHYNDSTAGRITAGRLLAYLTSVDLDSSWTKPYSQFLTEWLAKAEQYNDMCDPDARRRGGQEGTPVHNGVSPDVIFAM